MGLNNNWTLVLGDAKEYIMHEVIDLLITDVPNLESMPNSEIEKALNRFRPKKAIICCDDKLNLEYPVIQFSHQDYGRYPLYFTCSNIFLHTNEGDLIFDPFCGYSTTGICALDMDRRYFGVEINPEIYEISLQRLKQYAKNI